MLLAIRRGWRHGTPCIVSPPAYNSNTLQSRSNPADDSYIRVRAGTVGSRPSSPAWRHHHPALALHVETARSHATNHRSTRPARPTCGNRVFFQKIVSSQDASFWQGYPCCVQRVPSAPAALGSTTPGQDPECSASPSPSSRLLPLPPLPLEKIITLCSPSLSSLPAARSRPRTKTLGQAYILAQNASNPAVISIPIRERVAWERTSDMSNQSLVNRPLFSSTAVMMVRYGILIATCMPCPPACSAEPS